VNKAIANHARFEAMRDFFGDVGQGDQAGIWQDTPQERPEFKAHIRRQVQKAAARRKAEEMGA
jgi:chlorophyllide a reductase subunit Y